MGTHGLPRRRRFSIQVLVLALETHECNVHKAPAATRNMHSSRQNTASLPHPPQLITLVTEMGYSLANMAVCTNYGKF